MLLLLLLLLLLLVVGVEVGVWGRGWGGRLGGLEWRTLADRHDGQHEGGTGQSERASRLVDRGQVDGRIRSQGVDDGWRRTRGEERSRRWGKGRA